VRFPSVYLLAFLLAFWITALGQSVPPGAPPPRLGNGFPAVALPQAAVDSPAKAKQRMDPIELQGEAREILRLSQSIQPDIEQIDRGVLHKDVLDKLKRIEKLTKHLRGELSR
jgi:hypothetical protein